MSGARLTAALECANDAGVRFTLRRPGDSHGASRLSAGAAASCASADRPASAVRAAPSVVGATPQSEGLVRVRTQVCFHTPAPVPWGRSRSINPYAGRRFERRFEAADHPFADRPAVWQPGITEQGRGTPDGSGHSPSRQVRDAPVPGDRWPSRTGLLDRSDLPTEGGWACTSNPPRCRTRHRKRAVAPVTAASSGAAPPIRWPGCNRKAASDIRNRWRAHRDGGSVHMHLDVDVRARYATDPRRSAVKFRPPNRSRSPLRKTTSNRGSELASREASGSAGQGLGPAFGSSPSWAEQAAQRP